MKLHEICLLPAGTILCIPWNNGDRHKEYVLRFSNSGQPLAQRVIAGDVLGPFYNLFSLDGSSVFSDIRLEAPEGCNVTNYA